MDWYLIWQGLVYGIASLISLGVLWSVLARPLLYFLGHTSKQVQQHRIDLKRDYRQGVEDAAHEESLL